MEISLGLDEQGIMKTAFISFDGCVFSSRQQWLDSRENLVH